MHVLISEVKSDDFLTGLDEQTFKFSCKKGGVEADSISIVQNSNYIQLSEVMVHGIATGKCSQIT